MGDPSFSSPGPPQSSFASAQTTSDGPDEPRSFRLASYARWSSSADGTESLDAQDERMGAWALAHGHRIVCVHHDEHFSGTLSWEDRPGLFAAISAVKDGVADGLLLRGLDRFTRDLMEQEFTLRMVWRHGGEVFEAGRGVVARDDPDDPTRKLVRSIMGAVWAFDRDVQVARTRAGKRRKAARGGYTGGPRFQPRYGYRIVDRDWRPEPDEQEIIQRIFWLRRGEGLSYRAIAARLQADGVPAPTQGGVWNHVTVVNILAREQPAVESAQPQRESA